jgi:hypothetical protein
MTIQAAGNESMPLVTAGAIQGRMAACGRHHLLPHLGMAGKAFLPGRLDGIPQRGQRLVRVSMTLQTVVYLKMRITFMAKDAGGYGIFPLGRMLRMAVEAANLRGVLAAQVLYYFQLKYMALAAIFLLQH